MVNMVLEVFVAAAEGKGMQLQIARLREVFKFCMQAVRATKNALTDNTELKLWDLWRIEDLTKVLAKLARSKSVLKTLSLNVHSRHLVDLINLGSGRAKLRHVVNGMPVMLDKDENGKPLDKLAKRQIKKAARRKEEEERVARLAAEGLDPKGKPFKRAKKRKASEMEAEKAVQPVQSRSEEGDTIDQE